jgi:hypothetical protein
MSVEGCDSRNCPAGVPSPMEVSCCTRGTPSPFFGVFVSDVNGSCVPVGVGV